MGLDFLLSTARAGPHLPIVGVSFSAISSIAVNVFRSNNSLAILAVSEIERFAWLQPLAACRTVNWLTAVDLELPFGSQPLECGPVSTLRCGQSLPFVRELMLVAVACAARYEDRTAGPSADSFKRQYSSSRNSDAMLCAMLDSLVDGLGVEPASPSPMELDAYPCGCHPCHGHGCCNCGRGSACLCGLRS